MQSRTHLPSRRHNSSHGCKRTVLGSLTKIIGPKNLWFEPTGLSHLERQAVKVPWTPAETNDDWWVESRFADHLGKAATRNINRVVAIFAKHLTACVAANGCHFKYLQQGFISKFVSSSQHQKTSSFQNHPHVCVFVHVFSFLWFCGSLWTNSVNGW